MKFHSGGLNNVLLLLSTSGAANASMYTHKGSIFRLANVRLEVSECGWKNTPSEKIVNQFLDLTLQLHLALHPARVLNTSEWGLPDIKKRRFFTALAGEFFNSGVKRPEDVVIQNQASPSPSKRRHGQTNTPTDVIRLQTISIVTIRQALRTFAHDVSLLVELLSQTSSTRGMSMAESLQIFANEVHNTLTSGLNASFTSFDGAWSTLDFINETIRWKVMFHAQAICAALLHTDVEPNRQPVGIKRAVFHLSNGFKRFQIICALLRSYGQRQDDGLLPEVLNVVEIGVDEGYTSTYLLDRIPNMKLTGVDSYTGSADTNLKYGDPAVVPAVRSSFGRYGKRSRLWIMTSQQAALKFNGTLDMIFIDADHSYACVSADLHAWATKVQPGGIVAGHDYSCTFPGVLKAVHKVVFATGVTLNLGPDATWWFFVPAGGVPDNIFMPSEMACS